MAKPKMPSASVTAKPKIRLPNCGLGGGRIADRGLQVVAEDRADADAGARHGDAGEACGDEVQTFHLFLLGSRLEDVVVGCQWPPG